MPVAGSTNDNVNFWCPPEQIARIDAFRALRGMVSRSAAVRALVDYALNEADKMPRPSDPFRDPTIAEALTRPSA